MKRVVIFAAICSASSVQAETLHLVCQGGGIGVEGTIDMVAQQDTDGFSSSGQIMGSRFVPYDDQVKIEVDGGKARIQVPGSMVAFIHGGKDGWYELRKLVISETEITGQAAVSFIDSPKVRLDRITGRITIKGADGRYSGICEKYDAGAATRKF